MLWTGQSAQQPPRRWVFALNAVAGVAVLLLVEVLLGKEGALPYTAITAVVGLTVTTLVGPLHGRNQLTLGSYTVTDQRVLVESRVTLFRVRRTENLAELTTPRLMDGSVAFGDLSSGAAAGRRPTGQPISPLVLEGIPEPERVLGLIEQAQREARQ